MGYGGFGIVIAAIDKEENKKIALKIVDNSNPSKSHHVSCLLREAKLLQNLKEDLHDNIIKFYNLSEYKNYLVMSLKLTKENLSDFHHRKRRQKKPLKENEIA